MNLDDKTISVLQKLYNLRSKDSVILVKMEEEKKKATEIKENTSVTKAELEEKINSLIEKENILKNEGQNLERVLDAINTDSFKTILSNLDIDFNPVKIKEEVSTKLPESLNKVLKEKEIASEKLIEVEEQMNNAIMKIEELGIRKDEAIYNQSRLNKIFELALNKNINVTRDEITSLLAKFDFNEEEQRTAAKILMFPEDGLFEFDKNPNKQEVKAEKVVKENKIDFKEITKEVSSQNEKEEQVVNEKPISFEDTKVNEEKIEIKPQVSKKDELINLLQDLGYDHLDITSNEFNELLENYNKDVIEKNAKLIDKFGFEKKLLKENAKLFYDKELEEKLNVLTNVGKMPKDISLNSHILSKYNLDNLNKAISMLKESGLDPKTVPLVAY